MRRVFSGDRHGHWGRLRAACAPAAVCHGLGAEGAPPWETGRRLGECFLGRHEGVAPTVLCRSCQRAALQSRACGGRLRGGGAAQDTQIKEEHVRGHPFWMSARGIKQSAYDFKVGWGGARRARGWQGAGGGPGQQGRGRPALQRPCGSLFRTDIWSPWASQPLSWPRASLPTPDLHPIRVLFPDPQEQPAHAREPPQQALQGSL